MGSAQGASERKGFGVPGIRSISRKLTALPQRVTIQLDLELFNTLTAAWGPSDHHGASLGGIVVESDFDLAALAIDPDDVYSGVRDETRGREVSL